MTLADTIARFPFLASPAALMRAYRGDSWKMPPHLRLYNETIVQTYFSGGGQRFMANFPFQHGKALNAISNVPCPQGWKKHGDLQAGDEVYAPSGATIQVLAVGPSSLQDCEVEFSDGSKVKCHEDHEWVVYDRGPRVWRTLETKQLEKRALFSGGRCALQIQNAAPLEGEHWEEPPVDPYVLGAWLGDGSSNSPLIAFGIDGRPVIDGIIEAGYPLRKERVQESTGVGYASFDLLWNALREAGVCLNKHIPERYLRASIAQRERLLAGLIDTDGSYSQQSGQYRFTNTNRRLVDSTVELVRSLGFRVGKVQEYEACESSSGILGKKTVYVVAFSASRDLPCRLPRKQRKSVKPMQMRGVKAVRRVEPSVGNCIQVEGGQYLVGETLIPTHNSELASRGFPAWALLWNPDLRISIVGHGEEFAMNEYGAVVKEIVKIFGEELGIRLRQDMKAKGQWKIDGRLGGMACFGPDSGGVGYPSDIFCIDDLIRSRQQAMSPGEMDKHWNFYTSTVYSRLRNDTSLYVTGTRWGRRDIFGRLLDMARRTGEKWRHIKFAALAKENDILGRKPGDALWPEMVSQKQIEMAKAEFGSFFKAAWQQEPEDQESSILWPAAWPEYMDVGDAFSLPTGIGRQVYHYSECTVIVTVDWASSKKKSADFTAMLVAALCPDGRLLLLDAVNEQLRLEACVPTLNKLCQFWRPHIVACEAQGFQAALANQAREYSAIPEVRRLKTGNQQGMKLIRAQPAIIMGENQRILLPLVQPKGIGKETWLETLCSQLTAFTGVNDEHDDLVDCLGYMAMIAQELKPTLRTNQEDHGAILLVPGKQDCFF